MDNGGEDPLFLKVAKLAVYEGECSLLCPCWATSYERHDGTHLIG